MVQFDKQIRHMKKQITLCLIFIITFWLTSCGNNNGTGQPDIDFDQTAMLTNIANNIIQPHFEDFALATQQLTTSTQALADNPTLEQLNTARQDWEAAYRAYQKVSIYEFGPALENGLMFRQRLNTFPTNTENIENHISAGEITVDEHFKSTVGFPALEYLLHGEIGTEETMILSDLVTSENRLNYVIALATSIQEMATAVNDAWKNGYATTFIANTGNADGSSISLLTNQFNFDYETLKNFKFKIPLGKFDGGVIQPQKLEAYYSGISAQLAHEQALASYEFFKGIGKNGINSLGFEDYLEALRYGEDTDGLLSEAIDQQFSSIVTDLANLPDPLSETLMKDKATVDTVHTKMQNMIVLIKREMTSAFGVKITYQDNDGD